MYTVKEMMALFTDYFRKDQESNLYKLIKLFADELTLLKKTNELMLEWRDIDKARGKTLNLIGSNLNQPRGVANDEVYRILLKSKIARNLSDGTVDTIINVIATTLSANREEIKLVESWEGGDVSKPSIRIMQLPLTTLISSGMNQLDFIRIVQKTVASGVQVEQIELEGTLKLSDDYIDDVFGLSFAYNDGTGGTLSELYSTASINQLPI